jgi:hypothetical protein
MLKKNPTIFLILLTCLAFKNGQTSSTQTTLAQTLDEQFRHGSISAAQHVAYQLMGIQNSASLPEAYRSLPRPVTRLGSGLVAEALSLMDVSSPADRRLLQVVLDRPTNLPFSALSPDSLFRIHYALEGTNASADAFIVQTGIAYDQAYHLIVDVMGYPPPPPDHVWGPEYDVYVYNIGDYGYSTPESPAPSSDFPYAYTGFIQMDNDFISTYTKGVDGMRVTAAHEFFHIVQFGMRNYPTTELDSRWFYEACATWMEDVACEEVNDYLQYLPHYFANLHRSLRTFNGIHEYGASVFFHMLEKKYGEQIVLQMWKKFAADEMYHALDFVLRENGNSLAMALADHMIWNYFTSERADPAQYYPEGADYPEVEPHLNQELQKTLGFSDETQLLSARYVQIDLQNFGDLSIVPQLTAPANWLYAVISQPLGLVPQVVQCAGNTTMLLPGLSAAHAVTLIMVNVSMPRNDIAATAESYQCSLTLGESEGLVSGIKRVFPNPFLPDNSSSPEGLRIDVRLIKKVKELTLFLLNEGGSVIWNSHIQFDTEKNGDLSFFWDGNADNGDPAAPGIYYIYVNAGQKIAPAKVAILR